MTYLGLGNAVAIRVSHYNGSGDAFSIKKYTYAGVHLGLVASVTISLILIFSIEKISMVFTDNADVAKIVVILVPSLILYQMFDSVQLVLSNALRALEDVKSIMYISLIAYFFIAIPAGYFFGFKANLGINGLWLAYPVGFIFSTITFYLRFKHLTKN